MAKQKQESEILQGLYLANMTFSPFYLGVLAFYMIKYQYIGDVKGIIFVCLGMGFLIAMSIFTIYKFFMNHVTSNFRIKK